MHSYPLVVLHAEQRTSDRTCACGRPTVSRNHLACIACIERACEECPVLDTVAVRYVTGYVSEGDEG